MYLIVIKLYNAKVFLKYNLMVEKKKRKIEKLYVYIYIFMYVCVYIYIYIYIYIITNFPEISSFQEVPVLSQELNGMTFSEY